MKSKIMVPVLSALFFTASCAELGTALENANQVLGGLSGAASAQNSGKTIAVEAADTARYGLRNMKLLIEPSAVCEGKSRLLLTGSALNKTGRDLYLAYEMPVYNAQGERSGSFVGRQLLPPKEWSEYSGDYQDCIDRFDVRTLKFKAYTPS